MSEEADSIPVLPDEAYHFTNVATTVDNIVTNENETVNERPTQNDDQPNQVDDLLTSDPQKLTRVEAMMVHAISDAKSKKEEIENDTVQPIGLYGELSQEDYDFAIKEAHRILTERDDFNEIKNLEKDILTLPEQNYCVVNWVGPTFRAKTNVCGFRIMGAFKTLEKAQKYAQKLHNMDPTYDIGIMEMYLWCLGYPDQSDIILGPDGQMDTVAMEKERDRRLNEFIVKHKTQLEETKQIFEVRKRAIRKSKITKEGSEEDAPIKEVPKGVPTEEMKEIHAKEAEKWLGESAKKEQVDDDEDYDPGHMLDYETRYKLPNQEWAVVSFVGYTGNNQRIPICIKGVYASEQEAKERIQQLIHVDNTYDIVPMPLYKWVPCDPDLTTIKQEYNTYSQGESLDNLVDTAEKQNQETLAFHQVRKKYVPAGKEDETSMPGDKEFEYQLKPAQVSFADPVVQSAEEGTEEQGRKDCAVKQGEESAGEITGATEALVEVEEQDSGNIWMRSKMFYEKGN